MGKTSAELVEELAQTLADEISAGILRRVREAAEIMEVIEAIDEAVEEAETEDKVELKTVVAALRAYMAENGKDATFELLEPYNAVKASDLDEADYQGVLDAIAVG